MLWELGSNGDEENLKKMIWRSPDERKILIFALNREQLKIIDMDKVRNDREYREKNNVVVVPYYDLDRDINAWRAEFFATYGEFEVAESFIVDCIANHQKGYPFRALLTVNFETFKKTKHAFPSVEWMQTFCLESLLSVMYYQLSLALTGKLHLRRCDLCGNWEDMSGHNKNWRRHSTCANAERVRRHRG
jgi:hypothetical protein